MMPFARGNSNGPDRMDQHSSVASVFHSRAAVRPVPDRPPAGFAAINTSRRDGRPASAVGGHGRPVASAGGYHEKHRAFKLFLQLRPGGDLPGRRLELLDMPESKTGAWQQVEDCC